VNADRTVHQGVEAGLGVAFLKSIFAQEDRVWFNLAYTYSDFRFDGDATWGNNRLPGVPPHYLRAEVLYKHLNGFYAGPNVEWMPQAFFADNANSLTVDPYALLNFKIGYDPGIGWSGYLEGRNLTDKHYISTTITAGTATAASQLFNPGMGRAIYGGLRYRM
jgi:iron complex outermembrane receptor protein